jgi:hypothetical protein
MALYQHVSNLLILELIREIQDNGAEIIVGTRFISQEISHPRPRLDNV